MDDVFKFADVARPIIVLKLFQCFGRECVWLACRGVLAYKVISKIFDVFFAVAERRKLHRDNVQTVVKVFAETYFENFFFEVAVGGSNDAHVNVARLVGANGADFVILDNAQKFDLSVQRHVADFVEEYGAAVCIFEKTDAFVLRSGEGSAGVPEKLTFEKCLWNSATVDGDKFVVNASDGACNQVFTDTGFTLNEHRACVQNGTFHVFAQTLHCFALTDEVRHSFTENALGVVDFLEARNFAHQVKTERFG